MTEFAKKLEEYFRSFAVGKRLYYERRPHQYDDQSIEKYLVVTHQNLVRTVGAMFLGEPHITTRNFRQLSTKVGKEMFLDNDKCEPYYVAALALSRIEEFFKTKAVDLGFKPARYQVLLAVRFVLDKEVLPRMGSNEMTKRCNKMMERLWSEDSLDDFTTAANAILTVAKEKIPDGWNNDSIRTEPITKGIFEHFGHTYRGTSDGETAEN